MCFLHSEVVSKDANRMANIADPDHFWFGLGNTASQDYFTHFEPSQSLGGEKT